MADNMTAAQALSYISDIDPYDPGKPVEALAAEFGIAPSDIVMLAANENAIGMPESAVAAVTETLRRGFRYPDGNAFGLKAAVSRRLGIPEDWIIQGNGSDEILGLIALAFLEPGRTCVFSQYSFSVYQLSAHMNGARTVEVPVKPDFTLDLDAMAAAAADESVSVLFITNPNNPTGLALTQADIEAFLEKVPSRVMVVLDEAYREFMPEDEQTDSMTLLRRYPNLIVTRTFSKAYGLAGLRIGLGLAQAATVELLNRIRAPYNANRLAQAAASAAIADDDFLRRTAELNREGVRRLEAAFDGLGLEYLPTKTNFIMVKVPGAADVAKALLRSGIIVRGLRSYGLPDWMRISVGRPEEITKFLEVFEKAVAAQR